MGVPLLQLVQPAYTRALDIMTSLSHHFLSLVSLLLLLSLGLPSTMSTVHAHPVDSCALVTLETRKLMDSLFSDFALDNFGKSFADALGDDLTWTVTGTSPIAGKLVQHSRLQRLGRN